MKEYMTREKIRYLFDHLYSKGFWVLLFGLLLVMAAIVLLMTMLIFVFHAADGEGFGRIAWISTARIFDPGDLENDTIGLKGISMLMMTVFGLFVLGTIVGIINKTMTEQLIKIQKGKTQVVEKNHVVILGWNELAINIVNELYKGREGRSKLIVAIMANQDKVEMEDQIRQRLGKHKGMRVVCRTGNLLQAIDLRLMNIPKARAVLVLPYNNEDSNMACVKTLLSLKNIMPEPPDNQNIVVSFTKKHSTNIANSIYNGLNAIDMSEVIGKIIAHSSVQPGLSHVYKELLNYEGCEFYYTNEFSSLAGKRFGALLGYFESSTLVGILTQDQHTLLNPDMNRKFEEGEQLLFIAESQGSIAMSADISDRVDRDAIVFHHTEISTQNILVIGWNWRSKWVIEELDLFVPTKTNIDLYTDPSPDTQKAVLKCINKCKYLNIKHEETDITAPEFLHGISYGKYDHIILLSCCGTANNNHVDAKSMMVILQLKDLQSVNDHDRNIIIELEDGRNKDLIQPYYIDDIVVSNHYSALLMTQLCGRPQLLSMYKELFSTEGSEIYIKPARDYVKLGVEVDFYTVTQSARDRAEVAIGYKVANKALNSQEKYTIKVNPNKAEPICFGDTDSVIVLAQDYRPSRFNPG